jgi:hypothetical protein
LLAFGVGQPDLAAAIFSVMFLAIGSYSIPRAASVTVGVGQPACHTTRPSNAFSGTFRHSCPSFQSRVVGVGHPLSNKPEALADVRGTDARSAQICRPEGVARCFHVRLYSVEPAEAVLARNLLSKDDWRAALADEPVELGPEVALIGKSCPLSGGAEGLTRAGASPDGPVVGPSCETEGVGPDADTGEEVALREFAKIVGSNIDN